MNVNMTDATRGAGCVGDFAFAYFTEMLRAVSRCMSTKLRSAMLVCLGACLGDLVIVWSCFNFTHPGTRLH